MADRAPDIRGIFDHALEIGSPSEREAFLAQACAGAGDVRRKVEALLEAHAAASSFMESPVARLPVTVDQVPAECPGTVIGPYKLLEQIGEGGFGIVFMAEQQRPMHRRVALKLLKPGMDTRQVIARFEAERQALALMDHPNIARVLEAGSTESGRPYFVMELVRGIAITEFCDRTQFSIRDRLELFVSVCRAVQHAHQKGIIHRDIKPTNVLVTLHDGAPVAKVIDFGIAKATAQPLTEKTLFTNFAQMIGTPLYMSPEQAEMSGLDVDTRTDIYSLGVLLYELLTGTTPFDKERLRTAGLDEIRRIIREEEPARPSTRLSTLGQAAATMSANRGIEPRKLSSLFRGELDWIVMKALEKDRNRRYDTVSALAADVQRYLADQPVLACPPSTSYRLRKIVRRNKVTLLVAMVISVALIAGAGVSTWQAVRAIDAEQLAEGRLVTERETRIALDAARDERDRQEKRVNHDLGVALMESARLREKVGRRNSGEAESWVKLNAILQRAETLAQNPLADESQVRQVRAILAQLQQADAERRMVARLEEIYLSKGSFYADTVITVSGGTREAYEAAFREFRLPVFDLPVEEAALRIAASPISEWLVAALDDCAGNNKVLCDRLMPVAQRAHADPWRRAYYEARTRGDRLAILKLAKLPEALNQPPATLSMLAFWVFQLDSVAGTELLREAQRRHPTDLWINYRLTEYLINARPTPGSSEPYFSIRTRAEAVGFGRVALAARPDSPALINNLAFLLYYCGQRDEAAALCRRSIALKSSNPAAHKLLELCLWQSLEKNDADAALAAYRNATLIAPEKAQFHARLAEALAERGKWVEAITEYRKAIELDSREDDGLTCGYHVGLGNALEIMKDLDGAAATFRKAIALDPSDAQPHARLANILRIQGDRAGAIAAYREAALREPDVAHHWQSLGELLFADGDYLSAVATYQQLIKIEYDDDIQRALGAAQRARGDLPAAARAYREAVRCEAERAINHHEYAWACFATGDRRNFRRACSNMLIWLDDTTEPETAALILRTCLPVAETATDVERLLSLAEIAAQVKRHQRLLGAALYRAGKFEQALKALDDAATVAPLCAWDFLFRAMAHRRLGQDAKAREAFDKAVSFIKTADYQWPEIDEVKELRREAEALLNK